MCGLLVYNPVIHCSVPRLCRLKDSCQLSWWYTENLCTFPSILLWTVSFFKKNFNYKNQPNKQQHIAFCFATRKERTILREIYRILFSAKNHKEAWYGHSSHFSSDIEKNSHWCISLFLDPGINGATVFDAKLVKHSGVKDSLPEKELPRNNKLISLYLTRRVEDIKSKYDWE